MSNLSSSLLPLLRRVVTTHDRQGLATVESNVLLKAEVSLTNQLLLNRSRMGSKRMEAVPKAQSAAIWVTTDGLPVNDNNNRYGTIE